MSKPTSERRSAARRSAGLPNGIQIRPGRRQRPIVAKLVDASLGGLGVEAFARLETGRRVFVSANLRSTDFDLVLDGEARVVHSREIAPGRFRMGLELRDVRYARAS